MSDIRRQELHCHACQGYVQFDLDMELNGNHVLTCPNCDHEHCRVVKDGVITSERWDQRNGATGNVIQVSTATTAYSTQSTWDSWSSGQGTNYTSTASTTTITVDTSQRNSMMYQRWMDTAGSS